MEAENQEYLVVALAKAGDFENAERLMNDMEIKARLKMLLLRVAIETNKAHGYNIDKAFEYLKEAKAIAPDDKEVLEALAFNCEKFRDKDSALDYYGKLLEMEPDNLKYLNAKASLLSSKFLYAEALEVYEKILKIDSMNLETIKEMAELYEKIGNRQEAINCYEKLVQFCPGFLYAKEQMHKLMYKLIAYA